MSSRALWAGVHDLHAAGISHGNLDAHRGVVDSNGTIAFDDFSARPPSPSDRYWLDRDNAAVLVETALTVGNDRAVAAALAALGKDRLAELIPLVQPAALPKGVGQGVKHLGKTLKALRTDLATAAGVDDVQTTEDPAPRLGECRHHPRGPVRAVHRDQKPRAA